MTADGYDLLPHEEIKRLKDEIERLRRASSLNSRATSEPLIETMDNLTRSINGMLQIFKEAAEDMKLDEHDSVLLSDKIDPMIHKIERILEQNEKIAKGIVAIADMIEDMKAPHPIQEQQTEFKPYRPPHNPPQFNPPSNPAPPNYGPQNNYPQPPSSPPPKPLPTGPTPPEEHEKKKLFNIKF